MSAAWKRACRSPISFRHQRSRRRRWWRAHAFAGAIAEVALAWTEGGLDISIEDVIDELVGVFHGMMAATPH